MNLCFIDFEYKSEYDLVSCAYLLIKNKRQLKPKYIWLFKNNNNKKKLKKELQNLIKDGYIFVCFSVGAEASSFLSLGLNPLKAKWIDLLPEWKLIKNHDHKYMYGKILVNGLVRTTVYCPYWKKLEKTRNKYMAAPDNLASCVYKLTGKQLSKDVRDIIINNVKFDKKEIKLIEKYNILDVEVLPKVFKRIMLILRQKTNKSVDDILFNMFERSRFPLQLCICEYQGYPVNNKELKKLSDNIDTIKTLLAIEINKKVKFEMFKIKTKKMAMELKNKNYNLVSFSKNAIAIRNKINKLSFRNK